MILTHLARIGQGLRLEPVGVWEVQGEEHRHFYPPEYLAYLARGEKALLGRPPSISAEEWALYKVATSANWRREVDDEWLFAAPSLALVYASVRRAHDTKAAASQGQKRAHKGAPVVGAPFEGGDWGAPDGAIVQSWRLAAWIIRRHPDLIAYEEHPGGGMYDVLCVAHPRQLSPSDTMSAPRLMLNRVGTIQVLDGGAMAAKWPELDDYAGLEKVAGAAMLAAGWEPSGVVPAATSRTLAYRFIAAVLEIMLFDRRRWDARSLFLDTADFDERARRVPSGFPALAEDIRSAPSLGIYGEPESQFWVITRGGAAVMVVSISGRLHKWGSAPIDLVAAYEQHGRGIRKTAAALLKELLD